jgi:multidrug efflux pump subunit AcrA (membrane-fusion protein)
MARGEWLFRWTWRGTAVVALAVLGVATVAWQAAGPGVAAAGVETAEVVSGEFVDLLTLRGEVKAVRSVLITAPSGAGELQIVSLAQNGSEVKKGDVVVRFDTTTVERQLAEKRSLLKQAEAEIERAQAQARLVEEAARTDQMKAGYDVEKAKLDIGTREVVSRIDGEKYVLKLSDAEQKLREVDAKLEATRAASRAEMAGLVQKRDKAKADVTLEERRLAALTLYAPVDGLMTIGQNWRAGGGPFGAREWRPGDRTWPGSVIGELPELGTPYVLAKIDEIDRGRLRSGLSAVVTVEALPGDELQARISGFSTLAKPDYSSWPPPRMFDATLSFDTPDARLRPGMTGSIKVPVEKLPNSILVPTRALFAATSRDGAVRQGTTAAEVYVLGRGGFEKRTVLVSRRGPEKSAIAEGLTAGEKVALERPKA